MSKFIVPKGAPRPPGSVTERMADSCGRTDECDNRCESCLFSAGRKDEEREAAFLKWESGNG